MKGLFRRGWVAVCLLGCFRAAEVPQGTSVDAGLLVKPLIETGIDAGRAVTSPFLTASPMSETTREALAGRLAYFREEGEGRGAVYWVGKSDSDVRALTPKTPGAVYPSSGLPGGDALLGIHTWEDGQKGHQEQLVVISLTKAGALRRVGPASGRTRNPVVTADGKWIVFESGLRGFSNIFRVGTDGKGLLQLTDNPQGNFEPTVSPDGKQVMFVSSRDMNPELYVMSVNGDDERRLWSLPSEEMAPKWSPQGSTFAFLSSREYRDRIYVADVNGQNVRRVSPQQMPPAPTGTVPELIGREPVEMSASWSPDGMHLAYVAREKGERTRVWLWERATGQLSPVTDGSAEVDSPRFSPDGQYLAYVQSQSQTSHGRAADIYVMRLKNPVWARITQSSGSEWLPVWVR